MIRYTLIFLGVLFLLTGTIELIRGLRKRSTYPKDTHDGILRIEKAQRYRYYFENIYYPITTGTIFVVFSDKIADFIEYIWNTIKTFIMC